VAYGTGDEASASTYEAFTPIAQQPRLFDALGYLSSKNATIWGLQYTHAASASAELGARLVHARANESASPSGFVLQGGAPGGGDKIGTFGTLEARFRLYGESRTVLRVACTAFAPGTYLAPGTADAFAFTLGLEAAY
jgi:hypothetical protein